MLNDRDSKPDTFVEVCASAMFQVGRLDGALRHCNSSTLRIFAGRLIKSTLISALRQEGHSFSNQRFQAWFAGLVTLSDPLPHHARPPRALCEALLAELAFSPWPILGDLAERLKAALLAPKDVGIGSTHEDILTVITHARAIMERCIALPQISALASLDRLHAEVDASATFAPPEQASLNMQGQGQNLKGERPPPPSPRWALELLYGDWLQSLGTLPFALPLLDVIRLRPAHARATAEVRAERAGSLADVSLGLYGALTEDSRLASRYSTALELRSTSRAPAVFELLAGFGAMRSLQLEQVIGASRLGVRSMIASLTKAGLVERTKVSGAYIIETVRRPITTSTPDRAEERPAFSSEALKEYEASLAALDQLLGTTMPDRC